MTHDLSTLATKNSAYYDEDGAGFRRAARILQSLWRQRLNLPMGTVWGSELDAESSKENLTNYLTPGIRAVVRDELRTARDNGKLFSAPRIYNNLLSSQPLCFNLFGELKLNLALASSVLGSLRPDTISQVTRIEFEHSPGRGDKRFTEDRSAFDVFVEYEAKRGGRGFLGIEVKYHENLDVKEADHRARYDEVASGMECFAPEHLAKLKIRPLEQLWRDHLLAGSMLASKDLGYSEGTFVVVYPAANPFCRSAVRAYRACLRDDTTFDSWTLDEIVGILSLATSAPWVKELHSRYLDFSRLAGT